MICRRPDIYFILYMQGKHGGKYIAGLGASKTLGLLKTAVPGFSRCVML